MKTKVAPIILKRWPSNEMAEIVQGNVKHFLGNYWDFHPGCMGTEFRLHGENGGWTDIGRNWRGTHSLAQLLANLTGAKLVVKDYKRDWKG